MWELSTAHIDPKERERLEELGTSLQGIANAKKLPRFIQHEYGWLFPINREFPYGIRLAGAGLASTAAVYAAALNRGVEWVYLDRDADTDPNLPTYDD